MRNRARSVLLVAALLVALTGCVKVDADLKVGKDETVSGKLLMAIDKNVAQQLGTSPEKVRQQIEDSIKKDSPKGVDCKAYDEGNYVGTQCTLDNVPFKEMSGSGDNDLKFEKQGDKFVVSGGVDSTTPTLPNQDKLPKPDVKFKLTMPGKILEHDDGAQVDGRTATYTDPTNMDKIRLVSDASGGGGFPIWALIAIIVLVLLAGGAVAFFLLRGRKSGGQQQFPGQYPGQQGQWGPQQGGYAGQQGGYPGQQQYPGQGQQGGQQQWGGPQQGQGQGQQGQGQQGQGQWGGPQQGQQGQQGQGQQGQGQWGQQQGGYPGQQGGQNPQWGQQGQQGPQQGGQGQWGQQGPQNPQQGQNPQQWPQQGQNPQQWDQGPDGPGPRQ